MTIPKRLAPLLRNFFKFLFFLGIGLTLLYLVYNHQNKAFQEDCALKGIPGEECSLLHKVWMDFQEVNYWWILAVLAAFAVSNLSRAARWLMLLRPLGVAPRLSNAYFTIVLGYFFNLALPRLGEIARSGTFAQYEHIPVEKVLGTVVVDRVFDVISILLITALAFALEYDTLWNFAQTHVSLDGKAETLQRLFWLAIPIGLAGLAVLFVFRRRILRIPIFQKIAGIAQGFWQGILTVRQLDRPWLFALHSINIWLMFYLMTYLCFFAYEPTSGLSATTALVVFVFGGWGIVIPSPGGMGTYHFLVQTALIIYGLSGNDGFSYANIAFFSIQLGGNILMGLAALLALPILNRNYRPKSMIQPALA
ncbi:MAG: flippase-like domain-containing protein [Haliscomenobacter sp.]|nr:flippase-like domain-containing protein [Haliscomenobacter sp.]